MIDPSLFTVERLLATMLDDQHGNVDAWRKYAEIVPKYMPPYPGADTRPICVVKLGKSFLRGHGHYFWDMYGDDMCTLPIETSTGARRRRRATEVRFVLLPASKSLHPRAMCT